MKARAVTRGVAAALLLILTLASAPAVFAADGEIGDLGDTDSITDLSVSGGRITAKLDYNKDCPAGVSGCEISINFRYKCPEVWCTGWESQGWRVIPAPVNGVSTISGNCNGGDNTENFWEMDYRVRWFAAVQKTVTWKGENEAYVTSSGSVGYRLIAEGAIVAGQASSLSAYTTIETTTAVADFSPPALTATSKGRVYITC